MRLFSRINFIGLMLTVGLTHTGCRDSGSHDPATSPHGSVRVISLAPNLTEMIVAIGAADLLVGRSSACDYPAAELEHVPVVGGFGEPSLEALLSRQPTLIVDVALADKSLAHRMRTAGLRREHIQCSQLDEIAPAIRRLGELLDRADAAEAVAVAWESGLAAYRTSADGIPAEVRPLVFVELWSDPLMTVGRLSFVSEIVYLAGGRNMGDEQDMEYYNLSHERVIESNPDVILLLYMAGDETGNRLRQRIGWESIKAVRQSRIYSDFDADTLLRPGPRILDGIDQLRRTFRVPGIQRTESAP